MSIAKIRFENLEDEMELENFKHPKIHNINDFLFDVVSHYQIKKPLITSVEFDSSEYDTYYQVWICDEALKLKSIKVSLSTNKNDFITVRFPNQEQIDAFIPYKGSAFLTRTIFQNSQNKATIQKLYTVTEEDHEMVREGADTYKNYRLSYQNNLLDAKIFLKIPADSNFNPILLMKRVIGTNPIMNIHELFEVIQSNLLVSKPSIQVINEKNGKIWNEKIITEKGILVTYMRFIVENGEECYYAYQNGEAFVARKANLKEPIFENAIDIVRGVK